MLSFSFTLFQVNSNLSNKANTSDLVDKVRITGTVTTVANANSPLGYVGEADMSVLSGYPTGKDIIARVPVVTYSGGAQGLMWFSTNTNVAVTAKSAATYTFVVDILYKRG